MIGLRGAGKTTVFEALTKSPADAAQRKETRIGTVQVPDDRIDTLTTMYKPRKTIFAQVEYLLPHSPDQGKDQGREQSIWTEVRDCDALIHVVRNFRSYGAEAPQVWTDFSTLNQELILADLLAVEKRLERLGLDQKRGKKANAEELTLLEQCVVQLNEEKPLRYIPEVANNRLLRGYAFLSAKPMLVLFNNEDEDDVLPSLPSEASVGTCMVVRGKLEQELGRMSTEEAEEFLAEFDIRISAMDRVIHQSYALLGLISFFTVGEDEVRAWTIRHQTAAVDAAEVIHSDIKKGFIRAEVLAYDDLMAAGSYAEARKKGTVRLEGKTYQVQDGDIINFRFNV